MTKNRLVLTSEKSSQEILLPLIQDVRILGEEEIGMKKFIEKYGHCLAAFALLVSTSAAAFPCPWIFHQPVLPESVKKLRKL